MARINLGDRVKDVITNFTGIAIARTEWLFGCVRINIQAEHMDKDNKPLEFTFDEAGVEVIDPGVRTPKNYNNPRPPGGPDRSEETSSTHHITKRD